jgi:hypothetical protein
MGYLREKDFFIFQMRKPGPERLPCAKSNKSVSRKSQNALQDSSIFKRASLKVLVIVLSLMVQWAWYQRVLMEEQEQDLHVNHHL